MDLPRPRLVWAAVTAVTLAVGGSALAGSRSHSPAFAAEVTAATDAGAPLAETGGFRDQASASRATELNPGILSALSRATRESSQPAPPSPETDEAFPETDEASPETDEASPESSPSGNGREVAAPPADVREHAAQVLASLPGGDMIEISWNHPDIGNHLGGVRLDDPTVMMLNSHRFEAQPERVEATVKHEIAHYYQGATIAAHAKEAGSWWDAYWQLDAALQPVFGGKWMERSADCVALELGADWTHYTDSCSGEAKQNAVEALVAGRMP